MSLKSPKGLVFFFTLACCLLCLSPERCAAWGGEGHRIIAELAYSQLTPRAREAVRRLLPKGDLASVSTFADDVRVSRPETARWHFVDMPRNATAYVPRRDCIQTAEGDCAVAAIERFRKVLASPEESDDRKAEALKFLVHLVGDLHQPFHCGYKDDRGGNSVRVVFFGKQTNLHAVWDAGMIEQSGLDDKAYANALLKRLEPQRQRFQSMLKGTVGEWAFESYTIAVKSENSLEASLMTGSRKGVVVPERGTGVGIGKGTDIVLGIPFPTNKSGAPALARPYYNANVETMNQQLLKAGVRLALILNGAFK